MRITLSMAMESQTAAINRKQEDIARLSNNISSGKKLLNSSDDPLGWAQGMDIKQGLRELDSFQKNIDFATGWNQMTDTALSHLSDVVSNAQKIGTSALNNQDLALRNAMVSNLDQIIQDAVDTANTRYGEQYIFSGITDPGPNGPFTLDTSSNPAVVRYNNNSGVLDTGQLIVRTSKVPGHKQSVNLTPLETFGSLAQDGTVSDLNELVALRQAVSNGNSTGIQNALSNLTEVKHNLTSLESVVGQRLSGLANQKESLQAVKSNQQDQLSNIEDADVPQAIIQLQQTQTALEATYRVTSMLKDLNLTNFL